jgi:SAM-dependent methyltransferase
MSAAFDLIAPDYHRLWSDAREGKSQRAQVWRHIDPLFRPGDRVLDLGCGTGDDALHLAGRGVQVAGIDCSERMVEIARARGVDARRLALEELEELEELDQFGGPFSGAISNFGALNCVADLRRIGAHLARLICPGGGVAICIMGRFAPLDFRHAIERWRGRTNWRGMDIFYHRSREVRAAFRGGFTFVKRVSIGWGDHQLYVFRRRNP